ncbi:MAG: electron transfer flavoprotein subunit beta/FixA family protein [Elusimicrobiales bacterium]
MHILVCVKQTPATDKIAVDEKTGCLIREGVESAINPFDEFALEEAVRTKEKVPGSTVTALTMGPPQAGEVLRECVARGADAVYHLCDRALAGSDTWATSYALSCAVRKISQLKGQVHIVFCGKQTNDSDTGHIGPQIATWLDWPNAAFVRKIETVDEKTVRVQRLMEDGTDILEMPLPAVVSVIKEINTPRIASLKGRLAAKKTAINTLSVADIGADAARLGQASPTAVIRCFTPPARTSTAVRISGADAREKARNLALKLKEIKAV